MRDGRGSRPWKNVSHEYIYALLHRDKKRGGRLYRLLKRFGKRKQRLGDREYATPSPGRVGIEERPAIVDERSRLGDEIALRRLGGGHTLTVDNGKDLGDHRQLARTA